MKRWSSPKLFLSMLLAFEKHQCLVKKLECYDVNAINIRKLMFSKIFLRSACVQYKDGIIRNILFVNVKHIVTYVP